MGVKVQEKMLDYAIKEYGGGKIAPLAKKMGITPEYIYQVKNRNISVGNKFIKAFIELTGLSFSALFYYPEYYITKSKEEVGQSGSQREGEVGEPNTGGAICSQSGGDA